MGQLMVKTRQQTKNEAKPSNNTIIELSDSESESSPVSEHSSNDNSPFSPPIRIAGNVLCARHYRLLEEGGWFTDDLINAYFHLLTSTAPTRFYAFSSFLCEALSSHGTDYVQKSWLQPFQRKFLLPNASTAELVLFPVNSNGAHWVLVAWWIKEGKLEYYDSLMSRRSGSRLLSRLAGLLNKMLDDTITENANAPENASPKSLEDLMANLNISTFKSITEQVIPPAQPQQTDGSSCGPFCCAFADALINGKCISEINQRSVDAFRRSLIDLFLSYKQNKQVD